MYITDPISTISAVFRILQMKVEAFDLADKGDSITYFRREMSILNKVLPKPGIGLDRILIEFTPEEAEGIYPALSPILIQVLVEELALMNYVQVDGGAVTVTEKGKTKLENFRESLTREEREALGI